MHGDEHRQAQQHRQYSDATIHEQPPEIRDASSDDARVYCATSARASGNRQRNAGREVPPAIRARHRFLFLNLSLYWPTNITEWASALEESC
jgi:hypothetical protein